MYKVGVSFTGFGYLRVEADSPEEAIQEAERLRTIPEPDDWEVPDDGGIDISEEDVFPADD